MLYCDQMLRAVSQFVQTKALPGQPGLPVHIRWAEPLEYVRVTSPQGEWILSAADIDAVNMAGGLRRGRGREEDAWFTEPLRVVGTALRTVCPKSAHIEFRSDSLVLRFISFGDASEPIELTYDQNGIAALRRATIGHSRGARDRRLRP